MVADPSIAYDALRDAYYESAKHGLNQLMMQGIAKDSTTYRPPSAASQALLDNVNDQAIAYARKHSGELITGVTERTQERVKEVIQEGLKNGWSVDKVADELRRKGHFGEDRAAVIARTEISAAQNAGMVKAGIIYGRQTGQTISKVWVTDGHPCPKCAEHEGEMVLVSEEFEGGANVPMHPNCMCEIELVANAQDVDDDDEED